MLLVVLYLMNLLCTGTFVKQTMCENVSIIISRNTEVLQ